MPSCSDCPHSDGPRCPSEGNDDAPILIVGMAPGRQELEQGRPFVGGSGKILFDVVGADVGLFRKDCKIVNCIQCQPLGKDGAPTDAQIRACSERFDSEVASSHATVAIALGGDAFRRLTGLEKGGIETRRGYIYTPEDCVPVRYRERQVVGVYKRDGKHGTAGGPKYGLVTVERRPALPSALQWIVPSLHPAAIMREGLKTVPCLKADVSRAVRLARSQTSPVELTVGSAPPSADAIALDLETPHGYVELVGLSDGEQTWASHWNAESAAITRRLMSDPDRWKIAHNWQFDMPRLEAEGIEVPGRIFDTMLAAHFIQPDLYKSLEKSATLYLDLRPFKHLVTTDLRRPAADAQVSALMFKEQYRILEKQGSLSFFTDTIMPATRVLMGMTKRGIKVDERRLGEWQQELQDELVDLEAAWYEQTLGVNPHSPHQLRKYLYDTLGLPTQRNKYDGVTTDEGALKSLIEGEPRHTDLLKLLLRIREISKLKSTYSEVAIGADGCVHPGYLPMNKDTDSAGAATGRLASSEPNIQNQPPRARCIFVPHQEGMVLVEGDFSQIELRIAAALAKDQGLLEALRGDVFSEIMRLLGCDRVRAKNVVYGSLYGAGPRKLAMLLRQRGLPTTERDARDLQDRLARAYPRLWGWRSEVGRSASRERVLVNPFGRRRYFYAGSSDTPAAIDFLPQSTAADILWSCLVPSSEVAQATGASLLTTVHDSLLFEVWSEGVHDFVQSISEVLAQEWPQVAQGFRVPVKFKVGKNWGEMEEYQNDNQRG